MALQGAEMKALVLLFWMIEVCMPYDAKAAQSNDTTVLITNFEGPRYLSENLSTIMGLEVWRSVRGNEASQDSTKVTRAAIRFFRNFLPQLSPQAAEEVGKTTNSQLVLWGYVQKYGPGIVLQTFLSASDAAANKMQWTVKHHDGVLELGLPTQTFEFSPIMLRNSIIKNYSNANAIQVCVVKQPSCLGSPLVSNFRVDSANSDEEWVHITQPDGSGGWVHIPKLADTESEVDAFTEGMVAYLRGNLDQAEKLFAAVDNQPGVQAVTRYNALVLNGVAAARQGSGIAQLERALDFNPYSRYTVQAMIMGDVTTALREQDVSSRERSFEIASDLIQKNQEFGTTDPWFIGA